MEQFDLVSMGELLVDFTPIGVSQNGNPIFERNPGGGPANMACAAAKLGAKVAFAGKVGDDHFGRDLKRFIQGMGVNDDFLLLSKKHKTTLAFVHLDDHGERSFSFYRKNGADTMLQYAELGPKALNCRYFFCSSVLMAEGSSRETSFRMMQAAKELGVCVVFDPNLRFNLWESKTDLKTCVLRALSLADLVKVSEEELAFLMDEPDAEKAAKRLTAQNKHKALLVTLGAKGCFAYVGGKRFEEPAYPVQVLDTTAAGDSFTGGWIARLIQMDKEMDACSSEEIHDILRFANVVGGLTTSKKGSICALPSLEEVHAALNKK